MMKNEYKVGTLLQSRKHKHCIGMVVGYERKMGSWWHKINFAETITGCIARLNGFLMKSKNILRLLNDKKDFVCL
jgi:hypothetical protein